MRRRQRPAVTTSARQKVALVVVGLGLAAGLLEGGLRLGGRLFLRAQEQRNRVALAHEGAVRVLCIGESTTALGGEDAYPRQLERILNQRGRGVGFSVVNAGLPAVSTDVVLRRLPDNLAEYAPQIVVAMLGINDGLESGAAAGPAVLDLLRSLRTYKLIALTWARVQERLAVGRGEPPASTTDASPGEVEASLRHRLVSHPDDRETLIALGTVLVETDEFEKALPLLRRARAADPGDERPYVQLARIQAADERPKAAEATLREALQRARTPKAAHAELVMLYFVAGRFEDALAEAESVVAADPADQTARSGLANIHIARAVRSLRDGRLDEADTDLHAALAALPPVATSGRAAALGSLALLAEQRGRRDEAENYRRSAAALRRAGWRARTQANYLTILTMLRERGIPLVAVQYPRRSVDTLREMLGAPADVVFVDNEPLFERALARAPYRTYFRDAFAGDFGHTTPAGSHLLASNVARSILRRIIHR